MRLSEYRLDLKAVEQSQDTKLLLHSYLIAEIEQDRADLANMSRQQMMTYVNSKVYRYVAEKQLVVSAYELEKLTEEMVDELAGFGPLETLIKDDSINDILVNGARDIFVERKGRLEKSQLRFIDDEHVLRVIRRILSPLGRRVDEASPTVDARLPDGSRLNVIIPPLALNGPCMSIRKFRKTPILGNDLLAYGTLNSQMLSFLTNAAQRRVNTIISGGTGAGKTTLLNFMSRSIPPGERIVTIEDAAELRLEHDHVVRLETRPHNLDGVGEVSAHDLVRNALRMRPDRIILGEVRSKEVMDMLQAMNTGHEGCMSTVHANNPSDALLRLETLAGLAGFQGAEATLRKMIAAAIELIVQVTRMPDGRRRITSIVEVVGLRDDRFVTNELFSYQVEQEQFVSLQVTPSNPKLRGALAFS
ncbi:MULTISPECIES: CpaF family protein [Methylobacillus]|uniref:Type II secretion system protein E n=1 Tax=Methylobacillus flagellatus (strain ATCC 51484 / DSM 6875 / VKM B-1610 / KT) TaxID=265072 RepID=Q1H0S9_METFK|nr:MULTISPECIES: CpaF family protein [Methylobacillus]ABE49908.1 type II secretion system protein E [Methylobacillus flagellatus KT]MPS48867.1 CpaF family protein [Methylobacillus sp.]